MRKCTLRREVTLTEGPSPVQAGPLDRAVEVCLDYLLHVGVALRQIRLHSDVVSGEAFGRIHLQGAAVGGHRLGQQIIALSTPVRSLCAWSAFPKLVWTAANLEAAARGCKPPGRCGKP